MLPAGRKQTLNLFFPQWQGSGNIGLYEGAHQLYNMLHPAMTFTSVPVSLTYSLTVAANILGLSQINAQLSTACEAIAHHNPHKIFTLGGDCGVEIAPISFLNRRYGRSLAVIWLDAHGDLNTPSSSPSAHFHGMPLRSLLGEGHSDILSQAFSFLRPKQVFLVGTRDLDPVEGKFAKQNSLSIFSVNNINKGQHKQLLAAIKKAGFSQLYIHLDLDVLDPKDFSQVACPTPNGIRIEKLRQFLGSLQENFEIVGSSIVEFLPTTHFGADDLAKHMEPSTLSAEAVDLAERIAASVVTQ